MTHKKQEWERESGYIWSMIGSAVGFANVLAFSARCYQNGGGAFLIPFVVALLLLGLPMLIMEGIIGQKFHFPLVSAYGLVAGRLGKVFGWLSILGVVTIGTFYAVLTGYSVAYIYYTAAGAIPQDTALFFKEAVLQDSGSILNWGSLSVPVLGATLVVLVFSWFVLVRNIHQGVERVCSVFLPLLTALVVIFAVVVCFLPGAFDGFVAFLKPDFERLKSVSLWRDMFGHLFFSLSLSLGLIVGYSRHTNKHTNIPRAMFWVAFGDFAISFISGLAIFGCIGYMSHRSGIAFNDIIHTESPFEIGFIIFPTILQTFGPTLSALIGPLFFFCVFIAGVTGLFSILEAFSGNIEVEFGRSRRWAVTFSCVFLMLFALTFCMGNGQYIIDALAPAVLGNNMLLTGIAEVFIFMFFAHKIKDHEVWYSHYPRRNFFYYSLKYFSLGVLMVIFYHSLVAELSLGFTLESFLRWTWFIAALIIALVLSQRGKVQTPSE
tara:strand:+ start:16590 stop:18065 length:1476 start_codon:yes stop_codon:yes gene_type:complete